ncbi:MAG TPA: thioredoxin-disulfide reductase [Bacteroidota bacterium]|nr:thioredoxin-disulfide reductase [Bacteroidota bacterium]
MKKVVIIGSGPAGLTAALYTARANLEPLVYEGMQPGGQLTITTEVENFPGFENGIMGPELMEIMRKQAKRFGAELISKEIISVDFSKRPFKLVDSSKNEVFAESVIIATGAKARLLDLPSEKEYMGYGVSACATCDGFFYRGLKVLVVGGGDTAMEEANFLTKFASEVVIVHRRNEFRASKIMQDKVKANKKISFLLDSVIEEVIGETKDGKKYVTGAKIKNVKTGEISEVKCDGIFIAIGHEPNTSMFKDYIDLDQNGFIITKPKSTATNIPGVFACGDVQDNYYRQAISAAGTGCMAAIDAERFIDHNPL